MAKKGQRFTMGHSRGGIEITAKTMSANGLSKR